MNTMQTTAPTPRIGAGRRSRRVAIGAAAVGLVLLAACGTSSSKTTSATSGASRTGIAPEYPSQLRPVLEELVASMKVPSAVVLVRSSTFGDATFSFGSRVLGGDDTPKSSDHYRIGSITKTMTATVILQLAQEGKLALDDPISKFQPDVPNGDNITIAQLLDMRSGLHGYDLDPVFLRAVDEDPERIWSPHDVLGIGYSQPALFPPGAAYDYSNTNYILLGLVMEQVTGQTATELFQQRLFDPLGLHDTELPAPDDASIPGVYAHGYMFASVEQTGSPRPALSAYQQRAAASGELRPTDWTASNPSWAWTAGSAISSADDMVVWAKALVDGKLLNPEMQAHRLASLQPVDPAQPNGTAYGSGMLRGNGYYGHAGLTFGYNSQVLRNPQTDTTIVVLTGVSLAPDGRMPVAELTNAVMAQLARTAQ